MEEYSRTAQVAHPTPTGIITADAPMPDKKAESTEDKRSLSAAPIVIQYQRASVDLLNAQLRTVCFGSQAVIKANSSLMSASGGKADVHRLSA